MACSPPPYPSWWSSATTITVERFPGAGNLTGVAKADVVFTVDGIDIGGTYDTYIPWPAVIGVALAS